MCLIAAAIPGRGEYIRLALEASGTPYTDVANQKQGGYEDVKKAIDQQSIGDADGNPPAFAPPALRIPGGGKDGKTLVIHQTASILSYLGARIEMIPEDEADGLYVDQMTLTALDLSNETHDVHHPIAVSLYYEEQQDEAKKRAEDFRVRRIPKYFSYFERILKGNEKEGGGRLLVGSKLSYADTTLWQVLDGLHFMFPKELKAREEEFPLLIGKFYPGVKEQKQIQAYLQSDRRMQYGMGLFRKYPELDRT
ncbi:MAG: hypothetical protein Q9159_004659 [Coniocarpon cinnabarinum]